MPSLLTSMLLFCVLLFCPFTDSVGQSAGVKKDSIVFLAFRMKANAALGKDGMEVIRKITKAGKLKQTLPHNSRQTNALPCVFLHSKTLKSDTLWIDHPLETEVEYPASSTTMNRKKISVNGAEFFIRFQKTNYEK